MLYHSHNFLFVSSYAQTNNFTLHFDNQNGSNYCDVRIYSYISPTVEQCESWKHRAHKNVGVNKGEREHTFTLSEFKKENELIKINIKGQGCFTSPSSNTYERIIKPSKPGTYQITCAGEDCAYLKDNKWHWNWLRVKGKSGLFRSARS